MDAKSSLGVLSILCLILFARNDSLNTRHQLDERLTTLELRLTALADGGSGRTSEREKNSDSINVPEHSNIDDKRLTTLDVPSATHAMLQRLESGAYDYLDVGASNGGSSNLVRALMRLVNPNLKLVGVDISPVKVDRCNAIEGLVCGLADITQLARSMTRPLVHGVSIFHVLEHINANSKHEIGEKRVDYSLQRDASLANDVFKSAGRITKNFVWFRGPNFDDPSSSWSSLRRAGLVRYYETWKGHTCFYNSSHLLSAMRSLAAVRPARYFIISQHPILSSDADYLVVNGPELDKVPSPNRDPARARRRQSFSEPFPPSEPPLACSTRQKKASSMATRVTPTSYPSRSRRCSLTRVRSTAQ